MARDSTGRGLIEKMHAAYDQVAQKYAVGNAAVPAALAACGRGMAAGPQRVLAR